MNMCLFAASMLAGLVSGKLADRLNERRLIIGVVVLMLGNLLVYTLFLDLSTPLWIIVVLAITLGATQGMKGPVIMKLALSNVPPEKIGAGSGLLTMMRDFAPPPQVCLSV